MKSSKWIARSCGLGLLAWCACAVYGQTYPSRPVRIVTGSPGGSTDFASRLIAQSLAESLGQPVIVDNRGGSTAPAETVQKAPPDGYSLLLDGGSFWTGPLLRPSPYDPVADFSPITTVASTPNLLIVHATVPANSVKELIALAKAKPGVLNYAAGGVGGSPHLTAELFKSMAGGLNIVRVNYKGTGLALNGLLAGESQVMLIPPQTIGANVKSEKLKVLAITSSRRSPAFPGLPTMMEAGLPGYEASILQGILAPARTPAAIVNRLNQDIVRIIGRPDVQEKFARIDQDAYGSTPQQFAATVKSEMAKWGKVIKDAGITAE